MAVYTEVSFEELEKLLDGTPWRLKSIDLEDRPYYLAVMELIHD